MQLIHLRPFVGPLRFLLPLLALGVFALAPRHAQAEQSDEEGSHDPVWSADSSAEDVLRAVVVLELLAPKDPALAAKHEASTPVQIGFFVDSATLLTSLGGLRGAKDVRLVRGRQKVKFEVVAVSSKLDLAALRPRRSDDIAELAEESRPLRPTMDDDTEPLGADALTLYVPHQDPHRATVFPVEELLDDEGSLAFSSVTMGLSNLPIVDANGRLLAMWRWPGAEEPLTEVYEIAEFLAALGEEDSDPVEVPSSATSTSLPRLVWKEPRGRQAGALNAIQRCGELASDFSCSKCGGDGYDEDVFKDPSRKGKKTTVTRIPCGDCRTTKLIAPRDMWLAARKFAAICTGVDPHNDRSERLSAELENGVREASALNPGEFRNRLRDAAREDLHWKNAVPGRSIVFFVSSKNWHAAAEGAEDTGVLALVEDRKHILLVDPVSRHISGEGHDAFVVGTVAGCVRWQGKDWIVIERGRAVPVKAPRDATGR